MGVLMRFLALFSIVVLAFPALADAPSSAMNLGGDVTEFKSDLAQFSKINAAFASYLKSSPVAPDSANCRQLAPLEGPLQNVLHDMRRLNYYVAMDYALAGDADPAKASLYNLSTQMQATT